MGLEKHPVKLGLREDRQEDSEKEEKLTEECVKSWWFQKRKKVKEIEKNKKLRISDICGKQMLEEAAGWAKR